MTPERPRRSCGCTPRRLTPSVMVRSYWPDSTGSARPPARAGSSGQFVEIARQVEVLAVRPHMCLEGRDRRELLPVAVLAAEVAALDRNALGSGSAQRTLALNLSHASVTAL